jgi:hypothetical protein
MLNAPTAKLEVVTLYTKKPVSEEEEFVNVTTTEGVELKAELNEIVVDDPLKVVVPDLSADVLPVPLDTYMPQVVPSQRLIPRELVHRSPT